MELEMKLSLDFRLEFVWTINENLFVCDNWNHSIRKISFRSNPTESPQSHVIVATLFGNQLSNGMKEGNKSIATLNRPQSILFDKVSNCLIFTQENSIRQIKLGKSFMEWKLTTIFFIYRILLKQCEKSISKRLLLQLISIQILQISSSNEDGENWQQQNHQMIIERQSRIIEYIKTSSNLHKTSKLILFAVICLPL